MCSCESRVAADPLSVTLTWMRSLADTVPSGSAAATPGAVNVSTTSAAGTLASTKLPAASETADTVDASTPTATDEAGPDANDTTPVIVAPCGGGAGTSDDEDVGAVGDADCRLHADTNNEYGTTRTRTPIARSVFGMTPSLSLFAGRGTARHAQAATGIPASRNERRILREKELRGERNHATRTLTEFVTRPPP